jgi:hypothetical protein
MAMIVPSDTKRQPKHNLPATYYQALNSFLTELRLRGVETTHLLVLGITHMGHELLCGQLFLDLKVN